jgi:glycine cleavage system H protein
VIDQTQLKFSKTHEWLSLNLDLATVGITQHAQEEISDVVFVELPKVGKQVSQGEEISVVESVKAAFSIYAPVSGTVTEVNEALAKDPGLINRSPYEGGWIARLKPKSPAEAGGLMDQGKYDAWVKGGGHG